MKPPPQLTTADEVRHIHTSQPKLLDAWLLSGYRAWYKRTYLKKPKDTKELTTNKALAELSEAEWKALKIKLRSKIK